MLDHRDQFEAPIPDFEPTTPARFAYQSHHSGFRADETTDEGSELASPDLDSASQGGYSPPAWRRLENGHRSTGFWHPRDNLLGVLSPRSRESSPEYPESGDEEENRDVLSRAVRTRLPSGSLSPEKGQSPEADADRTATALRIDDVVSRKTPAQEKQDNCKCTNTSGLSFCLCTYTCFFF